MKTFILLLMTLLALLALSLIALIAWPRAYALPVKKAPLPIYSSIFIENKEPLNDHEKCAKKDLISFCLKNLQDEKTLSRALYFYQETWGSNDPLKKALEGPLLNEDSPALLNFWYNEGAENKAFFLNQVEKRTKVLWQIKKSRSKAVLLTQFLYEHMPEQVEILLKESFYVAQRSDDIDLMLALASLMEKYNIAPIDAHPFTTAQNLVADAAYFYDIGQVQEAENRLTLALFMNPHDEKAEE